MHVINEFNLLNVRVSKTTFEVIEMHAPFMDIKSLLKGKVYICCDFNVESMMKDLEERSIVSSNPNIIKKCLAQKSELWELLGVMKKRGCLFAHLMVEAE